MAYESCVLQKSGGICSTLDVISSFLSLLSSLKKSSTELSNTMKPLLLSLTASFSDLTASFLARASLSGSGHSISTSTSLEKILKK